MRIRLLAVVVTLAFGNLACATTNAPNPNTCAAVGALLGAGGGAAVGLSNDKNSDWDSAAASGAIGAVGVGLAGYVACKLLMPEQKTAMAPPVRPAPAPAPPPRRAAPPPPPPPPSEGVRERIVLRGVNFDFDKATIRPDAAVILAEAASILNRSRGFAVQVEGHTDATGPAAYNQNLSERRAGAVKQYLIEQGVSGSRLQTVGFGEANPIANNGTRDGRSLNRRVELKVLE